MGGVCGLTAASQWAASQWEGSTDCQPMGRQRWPPANGRAALASSQWEGSAGRTYGAAASWEFSPCRILPRRPPPQTRGPGAAGGRGPSCWVSGAGRRRLPARPGEAGSRSDPDPAPSGPRPARSWGRRGIGTGGGGRVGACGPRSAGDSGLWPSLLAGLGSGPGPAVGGVPDRLSRRPNRVPQRAGPGGRGPAPSGARRSWRPPCSS